VGPHGTVIALESSSELLTVAAAQVTRRGWDNVELINASPDTVDLSVRADAVLFAAAPQALACPAAVGNIAAQLRADARVAAGGWTWPPTWLWPARLLVTTLHSPYLTDTAGLAQPWRLLAQHVRGLRVSEISCGAAYLAHTTDPGPPTPAQEATCATEPHQPEQRESEQDRA
jgi:hypothetical protein